MSPALTGLFVGLGVLLVIGVWDDRVDASYWVKFLGQFAAVGLAMSLGDIRIESLALSELPPALSSLLTFVFLVGVTNAVNLSDGLDGLAGGMALICLTAIALLATASGNFAVTFVALVQGGAILGFLRFNHIRARVHGRRRQSGDGLHHRRAGYPRDSGRWSRRERGVAGAAHRRADRRYAGRDVPCAFAKGGRRSRAIAIICITSCCISGSRIVRR